MSELDELLKQRDAIARKIKEAERAEKANDLKEVKRLCRLHGFTYKQVKDSLARGRRSKNDPQEPPDPDQD